MTDYPNWFSMGAQWYFEKHMSHVKDIPLNVLQIGAYTGDASKWLMENALLHPDSRLTDVDTWQGSDEEAHHLMDFSDVEHTYDLKVFEWLNSGKIDKQKMTSTKFLKENTSVFNFVYIDGAHTARDVLSDFTGIWDYVVQGGVVAFDDYTWGLHLPISERPALAIDVIKASYIDQIKIIDEGSQLWLKKL